MPRTGQTFSLKNRDIAMDIYEAFEKRRTVRDFSSREVPEDALERILGAAFKAPTNDHLRQFEFVVVRDRAQIARVISPLAGNIEAFTRENVEAFAGEMDRDEYAMFMDAMPKQQKMLAQSGCLVLPFFFHRGSHLLKPADLSGLNYFASVWAAIENILLAATAEGLACAIHIPVAAEAEHVKSVVVAPENYEFPCFIAIGYAAEDAHICRQKEIRPADRIHREIW